ncbi:MAG: hypothetical protein ACYTGH_05145 [Planctomycetota bacterium]|jgi:uncharacterized membrane protein YebE (DUF533 family)
MSDTASLRWHNMVVAALANRTISEKERAYLDQMREYLGLDAEEAASIEAQAAEGTVDLELNASPLQQRQILRDVIRTSMSSGTIEAEERHIIERVAENIGMTRDELEALIEICQSAVSVRLPSRKGSKSPQDD